jgi:hypothetical protein
MIIGEERSARGVRGCEVIGLRALLARLERTKNREGYTHKGLIPSETCGRIGPSGEKDRHSLLGKEIRYGQHR